MANVESPTMLRRDQVRRVDRLAIDELGIPGIVLMENASLNAAGHILDLLRHDLAVAPAEARVVVLCGGGNNGGDGYAIARHLHNAGARVTVYAAKAPDELTGDARTNADIVRKMGLPVRPILTLRQLDDEAPSWQGAHVLVDALLGTGFSGDVREPLASIIERMSEVQGAKMVAIDVPSGLDCDTGKPAAATVRADLTVTFVAAKVGFTAASAKTFLGRVVVADIGVPPELVDRVGTEG